MRFSRTGLEEGSKSISVLKLKNLKNLNLSIGTKRGDMNRKGQRVRVVVSRIEEIMKGRKKAWLKKQDDYC